VTNAAIDIHHDDPAFGYRFIVDELSTRGIAAGQNRVARLCSQQRIWSVFAKRRGPSRKAGPPVHDDLVDRQFNAAAPNLLWLTDITEHPTGEGKLYLCAITDVHSNRIVGYSIDSRMKASLAVAALRNAIGLRNPAGSASSRRSIPDAAGGSVGVVDLDHPLPGREQGAGQPGAVAAGRSIPHAVTAPRSAAHRITCRMPTLVVAKLRWSTNPPCAVRATATCRSLWVSTPITMCSSSAAAGTLVVLSFPRWIGRHAGCRELRDSTGMGAWSPGSYKVTDT
jgi:hypothetical protein